MRKEGTVAMLTLLAIAILAVTSISPSFAYSSSVTAEGSITCSYALLNLYDKDGSEYDEHTGPVGEDITLKERKVTGENKYIVTSGTIVKDLYLRVEGEGDYLLGASVGNRVAGIISFEFDNNGVKDTARFDCNSTEGFAMTTAAFPSETYIKASVTLEAFETTTVFGQSNPLDLGSISFTAVSAASSIYITAGRPISVELKSEITTIMEDIIESNDGKDVVTGTTNSNSADFELIQSGSTADTTTVRVHDTSNTNNNNITTNGNSFHFQLTIPEGYDFIIKVVTRGALEHNAVDTVSIDWDSTHMQKGTYDDPLVRDTHTINLTRQYTYYIYLSNGSIASQDATTAGKTQDDYAWFYSGTGCTVTVDGAKDRALGIANPPLTFEIVLRNHA